MDLHQKHAEPAGLVLSATVYCAEYCDPFLVFGARESQGHLEGEKRWLERLALGLAAAQAYPSNATDWDSGNRQPHGDKMEIAVSEEA